MFSKGKELDVDKERCGKVLRIAESTGCEQEMASNYWEMVKVKEFGDGHYIMLYGGSDYFLKIY